MLSPHLTLTRTGLQDNRMASSDCGYAFGDVAERFGTRSASHQKQSRSGSHTSHRTPFSTPGSHTPATEKEHLLERDITPKLPLFDAHRIWVLDTHFCVWSNIARYPIEYIAYLTVEDPMETVVSSTHYKMLTLYSRGMLSSCAPSM
jgi:hypothetical protein